MTFQLKRRDGMLRFLVYVAVVFSTRWLGELNRFWKDDVRFLPLILIHGAAVAEFALY